MRSVVSVLPVETDGREARQRAGQLLMDDPAGDGVSAVEVARVKLAQEPDVLVMCGGALLPRRLGVVCAWQPPTSARSAARRVVPQAVGDGSAPVCHRIAAVLRNIHWIVAGNALRDAMIEQVCDPPADRSLAGTGDRSAYPSSCTVVYTHVKEVS